MAHYADLSKYEYSKVRPGWPARMLNVGWLAADQPFLAGKSPPEFVTRLRALAETPVAVMRGVHRCEFCYGPADWERTPCGNGEIRVQGRGHVVYAAPTLIVHYVEAHGYKPPDEFIAAVLGMA